MVATALAFSRLICRAMLSPSALACALADSPDCSGRRRTRTNGRAQHPRYSRPISEHRHTAANCHGQGYSGCLLRVFRWRRRERAQGFVQRLALGYRRFTFEQRLRAGSRSGSRSIGKAVSAVQSGRKEAFAFADANFMVTAILGGNPVGARTLPG
jgi:hypothetical protein